MAGEAVNGGSSDPIFVVGAPRSGTTLLAAMLAAHSRLSCGPETHFFPYLSRTDPDLLCAPELWPTAAIKFLLSSDYGGKPVPECYGISKQQLEGYLCSRQPAIPAILSALTESYMVLSGKERWVEKTPNHMLHLHEIRKYFPESPIIRILRDPRASALSISRAPWEWAPRDFAGALLFWRAYDDQSVDFFLTDEYCLTLRYEDLVITPETELRKLCSFLGEDFEDAMLDTRESASRIVTAQDIAWHSRVGDAVDSTKANAWRLEITPEQNRLAEALVGDRLQAYAYESSEQCESAASVFPFLSKLLEYPAALSSLVKRGIRFWRKSHSEKWRITVFVGEPDDDGWLGRKRTERVANTLRISAQILIDRMSGKRVYWIYDRNAGETKGYCSCALAAILSVVGQRLPLRH